MKAHRQERVAEVIREVASETILTELRDPRIRSAAVTVTRAEVSGDLQHAKVYVSVMGTPKEQERSVHALGRAAGYVQSKLGNRLKTRFTPTIEFVLDQGVKKSIEITRLINEALGQSTPPALPSSVEEAENAGNGSLSPAEEEREERVADATEGTVEEESAES